MACPPPWVRFRTTKNVHLRPQTCNAPFRLLDSRTFSGATSSKRTSYLGRRASARIPKTQPTSVLPVAREESQRVPHSTSRWLSGRVLQTANGGVVSEFSRSKLCVHPLDPLSAPCGSHERIRKVLCFPRNLVVPELHDAHGVGRLAVICQDEFGDPKITAANDSSDSKPLFARLTSALVLYVASTAGSLA